MLMYGRSKTILRTVPKMKLLETLAGKDFERENTKSLNCYHKAPMFAHPPDPASPKEQPS